MAELDEDVIIPDDLVGLTGPSGRKVTVHFTDGKRASFEDISQIGPTEDGSLALANQRGDLMVLVHPDEWKFAEYIS